MTARDNWLDRAWGYVDPVGALRRAQARNALALIGGTGAYHGADLTRRANRNVRLARTSGDTAVLADLPELRESSRDLARNNPIGVGAIAGVTTAVVGSGLTVQPQILAKRLKLTETAATEWQAEAKELFELWAGRAEWCDIAARLNFYQLQELAFRSALEAGDVFSLLPMRRAFGEPISTKVQLIEADRVCNPRLGDSLTEWAAGIKVELATGRPVAAAIAKRHPAESFSLDKDAHLEVPFRGANGRLNLLHLYTQLRPGQRRGVPYLAPIIEPLRQVGVYTDAEIMAAVIQGAFTVFVKKEPSAAPTLSAPVSAGAPASAAPGGGKEQEQGLDYGAIVDLLPGEDVVMANPQRPNSAFDPFVQAVFAQIAIALELPKEVLLKYFSSSYSAARAALNEAWRFYRKRREWLATGFCQPVYEAVLTEAVLDGRLRAPGFARDPLIRACYLRALWIGDAPGAIDPVKEVDAAEKRLAIGISDKAAETIAHSGRNWEDVHAQRVRELRMEQRDGMTPAAPSPDARTEEEPVRDTQDEEDAQRSEREQATLRTVADNSAAVARLAAAIAERPAAVVNVAPAAPPSVTVEAPQVHIAAPEISVAAPVVNVAPPSVQLEATLPASTVAVVHPRSAIQVHERDAKGELVRSHTTYKLDGDTDLEDLH